ncbi:MAG: TonB-dependent receptor plug domain-containing protein, partial [Bacteroidales bacterium]|nr:TonB-dependent receptor plug domain-containing protein [Bacteroidales bacterium]
KKTKALIPALFFIICFLFSGEGMFAQSFKLKGIVTDSLKNPLQGILVCIKSKPEKVKITNDFGRFYLKIYAGDTLLMISPDKQYIFQIVIPEVRKKSVVFVLKASDKSVMWDNHTYQALNRGEQEKIKDIISLLQSSEYWKHYNNIYDMIKDKYPDLEINRATGTIRIRGVNSLNNVPILIVVDGIKDFPLNSVNPENVASIKVIKDATSGMYGGRAMGGVIVITTKKGM